jgi:hypothetical protein
VLGLVENMSEFVCPSCHLASTVLPGAGGAAALAREAGVPLLASLPLDPLLGRACDEGESLFADHAESKVAEAYRGLAAGLLEGLAGS